MVRAAGSDPAALSSRKPPCGYPGSRSTPPVHVPAPGLSFASADLGKDSLGLCADYQIIRLSKRRIGDIFALHPAVTHAPAGPKMPAPTSDRAALDDRIIGGGNACACAGGATRPAINAPPIANCAARSVHFEENPLPFMGMASCVSKDRLNPTHLG